MGRGSQVVSETYDELVFSQPREAFHQLLAAHQPRPAPPLSIAGQLDLEEPDALEAIESLRRQNAQLLAALQDQVGGLAY